jgi:hypothetical protein
VIAITDDTPIALGVAASEIVGRTAGGNIDSLTATEARTVLNVEDAADVTDATNVAAAGAVMDADFTAAEEIMVGTGIGTHNQVTLAASEFLARKAAGNVTNVSAADARTILNVADAADVTGSNAPQAHGISAHTNRTRSIFYSVPVNHTCVTNMRGYILADGVTDSCEYIIQIPPNYVSTSQVRMWFDSDGAGDAYFNFYVYYGGHAEAYNIHSNSDLASVLTFTANQNKEWTSSSLITSASVGDIISYKIEREGAQATDTHSGDIYVKGIELRYTADQ